MDAYLAAIVEVDLDRRRLVVEPAPADTVEGSFPDGCAHLHVMTAHNPRSRVLPAAENAARNRRLAGDLLAAGLDHHPALGRSPDGTWREPSYALVDVDEAVVLDLADRFGQHAVYRWTPHERAVVWTGAQRGRVDRQGWRQR
ncbi:DUF3293 domain-containing protein [Egicoccus halophilus]|uniref:DUF3293 domain-containing protein n=1 Tax=Egicoccus halophilus TaxID=1670830 RepID=UPI00103054C8|nr:DUF3293 domain-containing protein [Egicoccus halophilus]